jgi:hypothetical protein
MGRLVGMSLNRPEHELFERLAEMGGPSVPQACAAGSPDDYVFGVACRVTTGR